MTVFAGRARVIFTVRESRVGSIRSSTQELLANERIKHQSALRRFEAAETLYLRVCQPQSWHFQKLGTDSFKEDLHWCHDSSPSTDCVCYETRRSFRVRCRNSNVPHEPSHKYESHCSVRLTFMPPT